MLLDLDCCWKRARSLTASTWFRTASFLVPRQKRCSELLGSFGCAHAGGISECKRRRKASKRHLGFLMVGFVTFVCMDMLRTTSVLPQGCRQFWVLVRVSALKECWLLRELFCLP